jgi:hypothetical protein
MWWRENAAIVEPHAPLGYHEAVPHIALMASLQKVVNGAGRITREYAAGRTEPPLYSCGGPEGPGTDLSVQPSEGAAPIW